ncbi:Imm32 family immunity protein [Roseovarius sp.]|uniref:Imm32 family immunity protein n=1 Tax=Roseovarius sp. TaxID=1486281 RepID=UPI003BA89A74
MITVEIVDNEMAEMHLDRLGIQQLIHHLEQLKDRETDDHVHLMTAEWGGGELGSDLQNTDPSAQLVQKLTVYYWTRIPES